MSLVQALNRSVTGLRGFQTQATAAGNAAKSVGDRAKAGETQLKQLRSAAQGSATALRSLKTATDQAEKSLAKTGRTGQIAAPISASTSRAPTRPPKARTR